MRVHRLFLCILSLRTGIKKLLYKYHDRCYNVYKGITSEVLPMYTWNFQYISRSRLTDTFEQLTLDPSKGDILIRIHTAIHFGDEAVELARFIKNIVPQAHIFGTSTSSVISMGKLANNQCIISVTQMDYGKVRSALLPAFDDNGLPISAEDLSRQVADAVIDKDTKYLLTFLTSKYADVSRFVEKCNDVFPGVQMVGGCANVPDLRVQRSMDRGFVFNENGFSNKSIVLAALSGERLECLTSYVTGAEVVGDEMQITDAFGRNILAIDGDDAAKEYTRRLGRFLEKRKDLAYIFPYVYSEEGEAPFLVSYLDNTKLSDLYPKNNPEYKDLYASHENIDAEEECNMIVANHNLKVGTKIKRAFIHDRKIVSDNQRMFNHIAAFKKAETLFGYSCITRPLIYSNCAKWEISIYENTNICGCLTGGEIFFDGNKNVFGNCCFIVTAMGEADEVQAYNPYVFSHTEMLEVDNEELLGYLTAMEGIKNDTDEAVEEFVQACATRLLYTMDSGLMNAAAMNMDINFKGYDRICMISVLDVESMSTVFTKEFIDLTYRNYIKKCHKYAEMNKYNIYVIDKWQIAIAARSYMVDFDVFASDMENLQKELFATDIDFISIIPLFCVIDNCTVENMTAIYNNARLTMMQKNVQFFVCDASSMHVDEESIMNKYHMVNVINYAIANDKVIPQYQGIYSNSNRSIDHYESLMRIMDENGKIYYPNSFLDVARSFGILYDTISVMMVRKVFDHFSNFKDKSVSINLGIRDIKNRDMTDIIFDFLGTTDHPENFVFEILENEDIADYNMIIEFVDKIHELGGKIALDDFGSGFSNLQHVMDIHFDYLKIDGSIVKRCCDSKEAENLIALISGWKKLSERKIDIIAEFVENEAIQDKMESYDIDYSQGFLFSKPSAYIFD